MKFEKFTGLIAAPFAPLDGTGRLNTSIVPSYYDFLERNGVSGAFINGTTGEGVSLTQRERQQNAECWSRSAKKGGKIRIINLVGGTCYQECIESAIHSSECGLSAIAVLAPYYFKPGEGELAEFIARVGESVPEMAVYYYHIPGFTGVRLPVAGLLNRVSGMLPNFTGVKYSYGDLADFMSCLSYDNGRYDILWGREENLLAALAVGTEGSVGSTYNFAAPLFTSLIKEFNEGNLIAARELQDRAVKIIGMLNKYGGIAAGKAFMKYVGVDCGGFRLPLRNLTENMYSEFVKDVSRSNLGQFFSVK